MEPKRLTTDQHAALTAFALKHGDDWKQLNRAWIDGAAGEILQPLYSSHGLSWLDGYSLADWPRSMFDPLDADPLHAEPDPMKAARACRKLIRAHLHGFTQVDWEDVQDALADALDAFGLDPEYVEREESSI